jgi:hypothetical protein
MCSVCEKGIASFGYAPHIARSTLADLETVAEPGSQLFPIEEPPDDLWKHIESAIGKEEARSSSR